MNCRRCTYLGAYDILSFDNTCNYQKYLSGGNNNICTVSFQIKFFHALLYRHHE